MEKFCLTLKIKHQSIYVCHCFCVGYNHIWFVNIIRILFILIFCNTVWCNNFIIWDHFIISVFSIRNSAFFVNTETAIEVVEISIKSSTTCHLFLLHQYCFLASHAHTRQLLFSLFYQHSSSNPVLSSRNRITVFMLKDFNISASQCSHSSSTISVCLLYAFFF